MNTRQLTGFLYDLLEPRQHDVPSFRVTGPSIAGRAFRGQHPHELTIVAHSSASSQAAERLRLALIDGAARLQVDAWSLATPVVAVDLPASLVGQPATMLRWTTKNRTQQLHWTAAWVRRGRVTWEVLAMDDRDPHLEAVVGQTAVDLMTDEPHSIDRSLWDLLPQARDLPVPMYLDASLCDDPRAILADAA
ncbi:MAG TPA: hypothetical protein VEW66_01270 [Thermomicrobiales bacterium]|nr:hypothetical protein [Thermomicrobiales bacterium]